MNKIRDHIKSLEEKLLHSDLRKNPEMIQELLSEDFEEIASVGKTSSREEVIEWLVNKEKDIKWSLNGFRIKMLSPELVLAIYQANKYGNRDGHSPGSIRTSIWKQTGDNWKM